MKIKSLTGYNKHFYERYCKYCRLDKNKDADPICKALEKMMEGKSPPKECENYKKLKG